MKKFNMNLARCSFVFVLLACVLAPLTARAAAPSINVIVISWDGAQRGHLNDLLAAGRLPNLAALRDSGRFIPLEVTTHQTDTKAGHTQMLTGYKPETTGVYNNGNFNAIPVGLSLFERLENNFGDDAIMTFALTGKSAHIGSLAPGDPGFTAGKKNKKNKKNKAKKNKKNKKNKQNAQGSSAAQPWHLAKLNIDVWDGDKQRDASEVGPLALGYLEKHATQPFFFFLHFSDPDHAGHKNGENSAAYEQGIITCDTWLGTLRGKLDALGIADRTLIYVTTDHGFDEGLPSHKNAPHIWLVTNDTTLTATSGDQMDIVPTILKRYGLDPASFTPALPGKPLF